MGRGDSAGVVIQLLVVITIVRHFLRALKPQLKLLQVNYTFIQAFVSQPKYILRVLYFCFLGFRFLPFTTYLVPGLSVY